MCYIVLYCIGWDGVEAGAYKWSLALSFATFPYFLGREP